MLFSWNEQTFAWFSEASEYTGYSREMAKLLTPYLAGCRTLCDMGCGMALTDLELAGQMEEITCVDISAPVIEYVRTRAAEAGIGNLHPVQSDGLAIQGCWDAVMALFHGTAEEIVPAYLRLCRDRLILVTHGSAYGTTGPEKYRVRKCADVDYTRIWLESKGYRYTMRMAELEFGQPHRSFADAVAYIKAYSKAAPEAEIEEYVRQTAVPTGRKDFPLYTPKTRKFGIFLIRRTDNEHIS